MFVPGNQEAQIPNDRAHKRNDRELDLGWLRDEVAECDLEDNWRLGIDPESAARFSGASSARRKSHADVSR